MVQVSYPGVYVQEVPSGVRTITSVATSIGAFFGRASKGPINKAVRILSLSDYERRFGPPFAKSALAKSVEQFFNNGGTDCYVVRLAKGAKFAKVTLESLLPAGQQVLDFEAKAEGLWANTVRLEVDYSGANPDETFNLTVIQEDGGVPLPAEQFTNLSMDSNSPRYAPDFISGSSQLVKASLAGALGDPAVAGSLFNTGTFDGFSMSRRPFSTTAATVGAALNALVGADKSQFEISVNGSAYVNVDLAVAPAIPNTSHADIAANIKGKIDAALGALAVPQTVNCGFGAAVANVGRFFRITAATAGLDRVSVKVRRASSKDIAAALMLGADQGGVEPVRWSNFRPAPTASMLRLDDPANLGGIASLNVVAALEQTGANAIVSISIGGAAINLAGAYSLETNAGTRWFKNKANASTATGDNDGVREKLKIIAKAINDSTDVTHKAEVWGYHLAIKATDGTINNQPVIATAIPALGAEFIPNVRQYTLGSGGSGAFSVNGTDGEDGTFPGSAEYIGSEAKQTGFHALDPVDLFNLMMLPEDEEIDEVIMTAILGPASTYCSKNRAFLLIDAPKSWTDATGRPEVVSDNSKINDLRISLVKDYAATFYPRLQIQANGMKKTTGSSAAIGGLMARIDATRGVWKAPAGIEAGIRNVQGVDLKLTDMENGVLNKKGVNCIRVFPNGVVNWGGRTLDGDDDFGSEWKYIPIRRLALMIEESLYRGTRWVVFEPNDEPLWANIRLNVGAYLDSLFRQGAFQGGSPAEAYFVKCDKETTTQDDRNKGIVNIRVGFAPLKPAEFVVITIQQMAGEL